MTVVIGELTTARANAALGGESPFILYSDPPWGSGNLKYWRTHNGQTGHPVDWRRFLELLARVVADARPEHVFIEQGVRFVDELAEVMAAHGVHEAKRWDVCYTSKRLPNVLWYSGPGADCDPTGMSGVAMTRHVIDSVARPGALVFDPCCGKGMTARCAVRAGMRFAGVELNPKRAQVTIGWLKKNDPSRAA